MISVARAHQLIEKNSKHLQIEKKTLAKSVGHIVAKDIRAPIDLPVADNSAMDGFVLRSKDTQKASAAKPVKLLICGDIRAGDSKQKIVSAKETYRIMTGAVIARGGDTVLPKERTTIEGKYLIIKAPVEVARHIRYRGEEIKKGTVVIKKHSKIQPATIGIFAMLGLHVIPVFKKPEVSMLSTGSELIQPGRPLKQGQIYDSNSHMIASVLHDMGIGPVHCMHSADNPKEIKKKVALGLAKSDVFIIMGGVSVGEYDFVREILGACGVETVFWRILQKPGKPLYFGKKAGKLVFGLPGNPASVFTCFYQYVYPALRRLSGFSAPYLRRAKALVQDEIKTDVKKQLFLKSKTKMSKKGKEVTSLGRQGSHMLTSLHDADSFLVVPPRKKPIKKGEAVDVHMLPHGEF